MQNRFSNKQGTVSGSNTVFSVIEKRIAAKGRPFVIGINGIDTSGKTLFSQELSVYLARKGYPVLVVHMDDYHNPSEVRYKDPDPVDSYINNAFNLDLFEEEILKNIGGGSTRLFRHLDLVTDRYCNEKEYAFGGDKVVLIEGVLLFRKPVTDYLDLRVYLHITFEEMLKRAYGRDRETMGEDVLSRYRNKYIPVQKKYLKEADPLHSSDIVIDNNNYEKPFIIRENKL